MKRFVIILTTLVVISSFNAADNLVRTIPLSSLQVSNVQLPNVQQANTSKDDQKKPDIITFQENALYSLTADAQKHYELVDSFVHYINKENIGFKVAADQWKFITENRSSLHPFITLQQSHSKKDLSSLKTNQETRVLFDHNGQTNTKCIHKYDKPFSDKIHSIEAVINSNQVELITVISENKAMAKKSTDYLYDFSNAGRKVTAITFDPDTCCLWIGFEKGGLYRYKVLSKASETFSDELQSEDIKALGLCSKGKFLVSASKTQFIIKDIATKTARMRIIPQPTWTKAYLANRHVIFSERGWGKSSSVYFTIPTIFGLGLGFMAPHEIAYLWWLNQLKNGLNSQLACKLLPGETLNTESIDSSAIILKASLLVNNTLSKSDIIDSFERPVSRVFKAFLQDNQTALTEKK